MRRARLRCSLRPPSFGTCVRERGESHRCRAPAREPVHYCPSGGRTARARSALVLLDLIGFHSLTPAQFFLSRSLAFFLAAVSRKWAAAAAAAAFEQRVPAYEELVDLLGLLVRPFTQFRLAQARASGDSLLVSRGCPTRASHGAPPCARQSVHPAGSPLGAPLLFLINKCAATRFRPRSGQRRASFQFLVYSLDSPLSTAATCAAGPERRLADAKPLAR